MKNVSINTESEFERIFCTPHALRFAEGRGEPYIQEGAVEFSPEITPLESAINFLPKLKNKSEP